MSEVTLSKGYEPAEVEEKWSSYWNEQNMFTPAAQDQRPPFSIVIPPPNVTGTLHMGHALNITLQDILCRHMRQLGYKVLWVPGTDHAGIATQNVVERALAEEGKSRQQLGREMFMQRVWKWKEEYGDKILHQIQRLGASVDWSRLRFTMDEGLSKAVREVFVQLYEQGLIYLGDYIINWCPRCNTALADLEVDHKENQGELFYIRYPLKNSNQSLIVATTRPETMLGDTALAVHPEDERYRIFIGSYVQLPLTGRIIPVISDSYVDREFGTGCLKITPGHDPHDFDISQKHELPIIKVIDENGLMTEEAGEDFAGLDRFACRIKVVHELQSQGLLQKREEYTYKIGHCYRCHTVIEPTVSQQWFVATRTLAHQARKAVENEQTKFFPPNWIRLYFEWLDNIRDWCISRQIWWGHRIPAWYCRSCGQVIVSRSEPEQCFNCGSSDLRQDEDVLDTWFSSALWPFSTLGWPEDSTDLQTFYPTSVLVTGFDIIFFWVARMMMMGIHFMKDVPFRHVYIHALVRDEQGQKMSKSTGNVIDPVQMIEAYGADALRFTLTAFAAMGRDIKLSEARIQGYKHFINKLWNAARFALLNLEHDRYLPDLSSKLGFSHRFILHELENIKAEVASSLQGYHFNEAAQTLYQYLWHTYCDWYLEMIKNELSSPDAEERNSAQAVLYLTFKEILILLHPFIPFVTQEIWSHMPGLQDQDLALAPYPEKRPELIDASLSEKMDFFKDVVVSVRNIRSELDINPGQRLDLFLRADGNRAEFLQEMEPVIKQLARLQSMQVHRSMETPKAAATAVVKGCELFVPLEGVVDFAAELERLNKELSKLNKDMQGVEQKLNNENFISKAPSEVVDKERNKYQELKEKRIKLKTLQKKLESFIH